MLKEGTRVRLTAEGAKYWGKVTTRKFKEGVVVRAYPNSCPSTERSLHHYDILWDGEGHYGVYDIDVVPIEPSFTVKVHFTTKNFDEAVNLASTLARAGGHAVGVVNADT